MYTYKDIQKSFDDEDYALKKKLNHKLDTKDLMKEIKYYIKKDPKVNKYIAQYLKMFNLKLTDLDFIGANDLINFIMHKQYNEELKAKVED